ncbi:MmgE/PrpD family protein [Pantoea sp. 18069]|uniref:MmgE/PrpD family protein n=1 Tax=Pantoea sp. 18069 TaxID=2681415 RepID=UPI00190F4AFB|nr:MmgE/PrpD family protein [Pantoea sp. 18069]
MTPGLTQQLGVFVADIAAQGAPAEVREAAKEGLIDSIGCMVAGSRDEAVAIAMRALPPAQGGTSRLWFSERTTQAADAALLNGIAAHVLDYDDTCLRGHPSAVLMPAIYAVAQERGSSGRQLLDAYVAGYETWAELVDRESEFHQMKGWHPTGIFGSIAAAAACAVLYGLDAPRATWALGLGASQASGLMSNFGAMSKSFHVGRAARDGVIAARLAAHGFTASPDALEHPLGFLAAVSPSGKVDRTRPAVGLGREWQLVRRRVNLKKYPTCYYTHRALDGVLALLAEQPVSATAIERIDVTLSEEHALALRNAAPRTALAAKFSMQFAMACAVIARKAGLTELTDEFVCRADVQALMCKVTIRLDKVYDPQTPGAAQVDRVTLYTRDGAVRGQSVHRATGHAQQPLAAAHLREKFLECLAFGGFQGDAQGFYTALSRLEDLDVIA